ncbi:MAG: hypothetical protein ABJF89_07400 [Parasphingorhabdus sp.]|uniref:hypothetical protein n=1 Tax=Parasphingorhabdus sp. TaxID=2709688 RepID=UPI003263D124
MQLAITGPAGFVSRVVAKHLSDLDSRGSVRLIDREKPYPTEFESTELDLAHTGAAERLQDGVMVERLLKPARPK